jgi:hypothetical protein
MTVAWRRKDIEQWLASKAVDVAVILLAAVVTFIAST